MCLLPFTSGEAFETAEYSRELYNKLEDRGLSRHLSREAIVLIWTEQ